MQCGWNFALNRTINLPKFVCHTKDECTEKAAKDDRSLDERTMQLANKLQWESTACRTLNSPKFAS